MVSVTNVFTAIFAGFAVFSVLGFMAHNLDASVDDVVQGGPGLAFIGRYNKGAVGNRNSQSFNFCVLKLFHATGTLFENR